LLPGLKRELDEIKLDLNPPARSRMERSAFLAIR
jgi:hypothetical protein